MTTSREDYLKTIYVLSKERGTVKNCMIVEYMDYAKSSVSIAMRELDKEGYIVKDSHGCISLTQKGNKAAREVYEKYNLIRNILVSVGVSEQTASMDACRIEHVISKEAVESLKVIRH